MIAIDPAPLPARDLRALLGFAVWQLAVGLVDYLIPGDPAFMSIGGLPYLAPLPLLFAFLTPGLGLTMLLVYKSVPAMIISIFIGGDFRANFAEIFQSHLAVTVWVIALSGAAALIRLRVFYAAERLQARITSLRNELDLANQELGLRGQRVSDLELRLGFQSDSILLLYSQLRKLDRVQFPEALDILLRTVQAFSRCTRASIWQMDRQEHRLTLLNFLGYGPAERPFPHRPLESSILGWVVRNSTMYSARQLHNYPNLYDLDHEACVLAIPILFQGTVWGLVSIEELPFERYTEYTESVLLILVRLVEPVLHKLSERELAFQQSELHPATGLPLFGMLMRTLDHALSFTNQHKTPLSLVIVEFTDPGDEPVLDEVLEFIEDNEVDFPDQTRVFHYKSDSRLALLIPNLDEDGTALLCMTLLTRRASERKSEILIGYAHTTGEDSLDAEGMIQAGEHLLEIQKI